MDNNVNQKVKSVLESKNFKESCSPIMKLLSSPEGQRLIKNLSPEEKKAILDKFMSLDKKSVEESLKNFSPDKLAGLSARDILAMLR